MVALLGSLNHPRWLHKPPAKGPVWVFSHCAILASKISGYWSNESKMSLLLTRYGLGRKAWSDRLWPTEGLFTIVGIIPLRPRCRIIGVKLVYRKFLQIAQSCSGCTQGLLGISIGMWRSVIVVCSPPSHCTTRTARNEGTPIEKPVYSSFVACALMATSRLDRSMDGFR